MLNLTPGNIVTAPRSDMMYVVTEFGMVNLEGKSVPERAEAMFLLAHPDFRGYLARDARANGLLGVGFAHDFAQGRLKIVATNVCVSDRRVRIRCGVKVMSVANKEGRGMIGFVIGMVVVGLIAGSLPVR